MRQWLAGAAVFALTIGFAAGQAAIAATTPVNPKGTNNNVERCLLGSVCPAAPGGTYAGLASIQAVLEADASIGTLTRVNDDSDQIWMTIGDQGLLLGRARYAAYKDGLGWVDGASGNLPGGYTPLLSSISAKTLYVDPGNAFDGSGDDKGDISTLPANIPFTTFGPSSAFRFAIMRPDGQVITSRPGDNADGLDHMVTLIAANSGDSVVGDDGKTYVVAARYIIAFEDKFDSETPGFDGKPGDWDYNDYVFELVNVKPVPLPAAVPLFLSGLAGLGIAARRRKT